MKRSLLVAGGTVGGLGAVLAITPPQISANTSASGPVGAAIPAPVDAPTASSSPKTSAVATTKAKATPTPTKSAKAAATQTSKSVTTATTPAAAPTTAAPASKAVSGTFTGSAVDVGYGIVQVKITVANGKITDAQAVQAPNGRNDRWTNMSVPVLRQRTLAAQSANINGVSGASYTSYGWYTSLVSALKQAGL
jgi:uncharacterized protein with FMN-binding domain